MSKLCYVFPTKADLPPGWRITYLPTPFFIEYVNTSTKLQVICSVAEHGDGYPWLHVSYGFHNRTPSHDIGVYVKRHFIGDDLEAISIFPPKSRWVSIHSHILHFWVPLDTEARTWPEFEKAAEEEFGFKSI